MPGWLEKRLLASRARRLAESAQPAPPRALPNPFAAPRGAEPPQEQAAIGARPIEGSDRVERPESAAGPLDVGAALAEVAEREPGLAEQLLRLDPHQRAAVLHPGRAQLIEAQVGSGKTTVLVLRLLWLWKVRGVPLERIAALTFTSRAAAQLRERIAALAPGGAPPPEALRLVGTFHAVARRLLLEELPLGELGYPGGFRLLEPGQREALQEGLIERHGLLGALPGDRRRLARRLERARQGRPLPPALARLRALYEAEKRARGLLDFEDLLAHATALLRRAPRGWEPRWVLVDELQDVSPEQLDFLDALGGPDSGWTAVGDPRQSIYGWRGARPELLQRFARARRAVVLGLPVNYRSSATIVEGARALVEGRDGTLALEASRGPGTPLTSIAHHDPSSEAEWVVARLRALQREGLAWEDLAVLCRLREQLTPLAQALAGAAIPFRAPGPAGPGPLPVLAWLRRALLGGLAGRADLVRAALFDRRFGPLAGRRLKALEDPPIGDDPLLLGLRGTLDAAAQRARQPARRAALRAGLGWCARLAELPVWLASRQEPELPGARLPGARLPGDVAAHLDLLTLVRPTAADGDRDRAAVEDALTRWLGGSDADPAGRLRAVLTSEDWAGPGAVSIPTDEEPVTARGVTLSTLHGAKGLEWRRVFLVGLNEGVVPLGVARDHAARAEEQRLLFVGLTRARDGVELSWCRLPAVARARGGPSPFLALLPGVVPALPVVPAPLPVVPAPLPVGPDPLPVGPDPPVVPALAPAPALGAPAPDGTDPVPWSSGQAVRHRRYGLGAVLVVEGSEVVCRFAHGERRFLLVGCPLSPA